MEAIRMSGIKYQTGYVYCMKEITTGRYKIGITFRSPFVRLNELNGSIFG